MKPKILVPIDFSKVSINALRNAVMVANKMNLPILMVHSFLLPEPYVGISSKLAPHEMVDEVEEEGNRDFVKLIDQMPELKAIEYECLVQHGDLNTVLQHTIDTQDIEMIIMGTHGCFGIREEMMSSNTYHTIEEIQMPMLIIPEHSGLIRMKRIALLSDLKNIENPHILEPLNDIIKAYKSELDIVHFGDPNSMSKEEKEQAEHMNVQFDNVRHTYHVVNLDKVEEDIHDYVLLHNINVLTMIPRKHKFFSILFGEPSWTKQMVYHTTTPLLILPG